jgi:hypothetical protein
MKYRCFCGQTFNRNNFYIKHKEKCDMDTSTKIQNLILYAYSLNYKCEKVKKNIIHQHSKLSNLSSKDSYLSSISDLSSDNI